MTTSSQQIYFRQRNKTFYADLERLHQVLVSTGLRVLEVGCGTGDLLAQLKPSHGVGIELDPEVAAVARERHPELRILATNAETMTPQSIGETQPFDVILLPNTLNTLQDVQGVLERLEALSPADPPGGEFPQLALATDAEGGRAPGSATTAAPRKLADPQRRP